MDGIQSKLEHIWKVLKLHGQRILEVVFLGEYDGGKNQTDLYDTWMGFSNMQNVLPKVAVSACSTGTVKLSWGPLALQSYAEIKKQIRNELQH